MDIRPENDFNVAPKFVNESTTDIVLSFKDNNSMVSMNRAAYIFGGMLIWRYLNFDEQQYNSEYVYNMTQK